MRTGRNGDLNWRGPRIHATSKDGVLEATVVMGGSGTSRIPRQGLPQPPRLPRIHLRRYSRYLQPNLHVVAGQLTITYSLTRCHVRLYSKHRQDRGDADPSTSWRTYLDPETHTPWEYFSGPRGRRFARTSGRKPIDVDDSERSSSSDLSWAMDDERHDWTPTPPRRQ